MRSLVLIAALALAAGCGKQLNAEFCAQNPHDQDCINAGLTFIDAPAPCSSDMQCAGMAGQTVCDTTKSECVECTPSDQTSCAGMHCGPDDQCHVCVVNADCGAGGICLPGYTCASSDSFLYTTPNGTGNCKMVTPCTLKTAIGMLDITHRVIAVGVGDYKEGPLTIGVNAILIGQGVNADPSATTITNAGGQNGSVFTVQGAQIAVAFDYVSIYGSPDSDGVTCTSGEVSFLGAALYLNAGYGVTTSGGCMLDLERSTIRNNDEAALATTNSAITVVNNFMYANGNGNMDGGAVRLNSGTTGSFIYNSISFNQFKAANTDGGFTCAGGGSATVQFNIIAGNVGKQAYTPGGCKLSENYVGQSADMVHYASMVVPYDLHLTGATQAEPPLGDPRTIYIRDNTHTICTTVDIDGDSRPQHFFCDLGADELK